MNNDKISALEVSFNQLAEILVEKKQQDEYFTFKLSWEQSQFTRFNHARVRQIGCVIDGWIELKLMYNQRSNYRRFPFVGNFELDWKQLYQALQELRQEISYLPLDPYLVLPVGNNNNNSHELYPGELLSEDSLVYSILSEVEELDFTGIYAGGVTTRGYADSCGQKHWFASDSFTLDYSIFNLEGQAVKGNFFGSRWHQDTYRKKIADSKRQLQLLCTSTRKVPRGKYRTYLAPAAVSELLMMLSWKGISEADIQQGNSSLAELYHQEKALSPIFYVKENLNLGLVPRFNQWGEIAAPELPIIEKGVLVNTLANSRTAKEYGKIPNGANASETLRSPEISPGTLTSEEILPQLDTGLYISNLHYLNWSDCSTGRITGMTRYACFWVESGKIVAPIENLRFDESLYCFWGKNLLDLTNFQEFIPEVDTYESRQLGGSLVPGMLVKDFTYTL
ncbi:TldE/PmbA family protein,Beta/Gamma-proteobacterial subgroup [Richelia intracellularis HH01]|uniref:TldE/PmbA family protein,Beta/Gamma-proteobacterial subgroup n=1 Tax=Richelia intracellularis HH01 TaxID=1165094 RepID=M1WYZ0_9NOST|nr:TldD/PmbA family protein [Richelia intracellularis]CCH67142.1 TldE/PmbA family protein,Beta/Gamma-proteobacterial subgroup [Richelia intracellularis HH01]HAE05490.1 TldD/PmbA family protein [Richelia sp.]